ncbi:hypothetical protein [Flavivirga sp. 57AJ16]|uniref:hypothetical protein n=1 Tax=Flavivirga sp. 57AJ16 TaxID=3025307 RepID=UPI0023655E87|nr:hypothetical protein [Flavivirga sp. 57AJ16]MDD7888093.1 hypothetical protein [Flavivirga sp. 57AJ16]
MVPIDSVFSGYVTGIFTTTGVSAIAVLYTLVLVFWYKEISILNNSPNIFGCLWHYSHCYVVNWSIHV